MKKLMVSAAAVIAVAAFTVPASAENLGGGPRVQNGKCWIDHGGHDARFGTWGACPRAASVGDSTCHLGQLAWEKTHVGFYYFDVCKGLDASGKPIGGAPAGAAAQPNARASR